MRHTRPRLTASAAFGLVSLILAQGVALAAAGDLDSTFDRNGKRVIESRNAVAWIGLVQPDAKIVLAGWELADNTPLVARLRPNGALDQSFGDGGFVEQPFQQISMTFPPGDAAVQDDGDILVAGSSDRSFATARLLPDGFLDPSFGGDGFAVTHFGARITGAHIPDKARGIAADGSDVVVAGTTDFQHWGVVRYLSDGNRDPSFGTDGKVVTGAFGYVTDVAVQPDGKVVVAGYGGGAITIVRYLHDGSLDPSFGVGGIARPQGSAVARAQLGHMALAPDGTILLSGIFGRRFGVLRLTPQGTRDATFGTQGLVTTEFDGRQRGSAFSVVVQPDGKIVAAGCAIDRAGGSALARYLSDGSLDPTFGDGGTVVTPWMRKDSPYGGCAFDIAMMPDGRLVTVGEQTPNAPTDHIAVARYLGD